MTLHGSTQQCISDDVGEEELAALAPSATVAGAAPAEQHPDIIVSAVRYCCYNAHVSRAPMIGLVSGGAYVDLEVVMGPDCLPYCCRLIASSGTLSASR